MYECMYHVQVYIYAWMYLEHIDACVCNDKHVYKILRI